MEEYVPKVARVADTQTFVGRVERERVHFNRLAESNASRGLLMPRYNIDRYDNPAESTPFPLEYAFHLLGDLHGKTVVDVGCGEGVDTVILASLGAKVLSVDISDKSLELTRARARANGVEANVTPIHSDVASIPIEDCRADRVLCAAILHHVDCVRTAREIRRILKPGGAAVFLEPLEGPQWVTSLKNLLPKRADVSEDEQPLTMQQVEAVSRTVGREGRQRAFFLFTTRLLSRLGVQSLGIIKTSHRLDAWILRNAACAASLATPVVWEAYKQN